jgi:hypothetical protein
LTEAIQIAVQMEQKWITNHKPLVNLGAVHTKALSQIQEAMLKYDFEIIFLSERK